MSTRRDIVIVGGGLAGLTCANLLSKAGYPVILLERKHYPFHRVCGEYISNEVEDFLIREDLLPIHLNPPKISRFRLTSVSGQSHTIDLPMGGFGLSRYTFDQYLAEKARSQGAEIRENSRVTHISREGEAFKIKLEGRTDLEAGLVIGSFGKRSTLDQSLERVFFKKKSPYLGVKYHLRTEHPADLIALHNFKDGYCGISQVEGDTYNLCYLTHRNNLKQSANIAEMEEQILFENPFLKTLFQESDFLFEKPLTINEVSFSPKSLIEDGILMCGDAAGMVTPLCGNGMAMAIHAAKILSESIIESSGDHQFNMDQITRRYTRQWRELFSRRLFVGRTVQRLFGGTTTSNLAVQLLKTGLGERLVGMTHGKKF